MNQPLAHTSNKLKTCWVDGDTKVRIKPFFSLQALGERRQILKLSNTQDHSPIITTALLFPSVPQNKYPSRRCDFYSTYKILWEMPQYFILFQNQNTSECKSSSWGPRCAVQKPLGTYLDHITWMKPSCPQPRPITTHALIVQALTVRQVQTALRCLPSLAQSSAKAEKAQSLISRLSSYTT